MVTWDGRSQLTITTMTIMIQTVLNYTKEPGGTAPAIVRTSMVSIIVDLNCRTPTVWIGTHGRDSFTRYHLLR